jgi:hypothetical protein
MKATGGRKIEEHGYRPPNRLPSGASIMPSSKELAAKMLAHMVQNPTALTAFRKLPTVGNTEAKDSKAVAAFIKKHLKIDATPAQAAGMEKHLRAEAAKIAQTAQQYHHVASYFGDGGGDIVNQKNS